MARESNGVQGRGEGGGVGMQEEEEEQKENEDDDINRVKRYFWGVYRFAQTCMATFPSCAHLVSVPRLIVIASSHQLLHHGLYACMDLVHGGVTGKVSTRVEDGLPFHTRHVDLFDLFRFQLG